MFPSPVRQLLYICFLIAHYQSDGAKTFGNEQLIKPTAEAEIRAEVTLQPDHRSVLHSKAGEICSFTGALRSTKYNDAMALDNRQ